MVFTGQYVPNEGPFSILPKTRKCYHYIDPDPDADPTPFIMFLTVENLTIRTYPAELILLGVPCFECPNCGHFTYSHVVDWVITRLRRSNICGSVCYDTILSEMLGAEGK